MALNLGLGFLLSARDLASGVFDRVGQRLRGLSTGVDRTSSRMTHAVGELGGSLGQLAAGVSGALGGVATLREASSFDDALRQIQAVSGATADEMQRLEASSLEAGIATQFSPTEAAVGLRDLTQAGFSATESMQMLVPVLDLAAGSLGELSPQEAGGLAAQALKAFGLQAGDTGRAVDQMLQAVNVFALSARELPLALGTASRGAQTTNQSLEETLIALGLVKNVIPGVERASTAVAVSMGELARTDAQRTLRGVGVAVTDSQGRFRDFLDILVDLEPVLSRMTEQRRAAFLRKAFGTEALAGVLAISQQLRTGVRGATGEVLRGADAVAYLRGQFQNAGGTAARFRDTLLGGFRGQWTLFVGSLKTLAVAIGRPILEVLTPAVTRLGAAATAVAHAFLALPPPVRKAIALVIGAVASLSALTSALTAVRGATGLLRVGLGVLGVEMGGVLAIGWPILLLLGALALAFAAFKVAYQRNLGGFHDAVVRIGHVVSLTLRALGQLFSDGGFSGAVREELRKAEHQGLRRFVIGVYMLVHRVRAFLHGLAEGFRATLVALRPVFDDLGEALEQAAFAFAHLVQTITGGANDLPSSAFVAFGQAVGKVLAGIVAVVAQSAAMFARVVGGILDGLAEMWVFIAPAFHVLEDALGSLVDALGDLFGATRGSGTGVSASTSAWRRFGLVLGKIVGGAITVLVLALAGLAKVITWSVRALDATTTLIARFLRGVIDAVSAVVRFFSSDVPSAFRSFGRGVADVFTGIWSFLVAIKDAILEVIDAIVRAVEAVGDTLQAAWTKVTSLPGSAWDAATSVFRRDEGSLPLAQALRLPATAPAAAAQSGVQLVGVDGQARASTASAAPAAGVRDVNVRLDVDGETLARVVQRVRDDQATRAFASGAHP